MKSVLTSGGLNLFIDVVDSYISSRLLTHYAFTFLCFEVRDYFINSGISVYKLVGVIFIARPRFFKPTCDSLHVCLDTEVSRASAHTYFPMKLYVVGRRQEPNRGGVLYLQVQNIHKHINKR